MLGIKFRSTEEMHKLEQPIALFLRREKPSRSFLFYFLAG